MPGTRVKIKWYGKQAKRRIAANGARQLDQVGEFLRGRIARNISAPTRTQGPSAPGDMPHAETGKLRQSIFSDRIKPHVIIVGSTLKYARYLEYGTEHMAARPFLRRTIDENRRQIQRLLARKPQ